ncbi:hypothetical protein OAV71_03810 [Opitutales bacterium]|jgi:hypothetical protein|nr:hypothetical protein [Opitutales bacterium]
MMIEDDTDKPLDDLLSLRGKPFADWKEERKYLRDKWGIQGRQVLHDDEESKKGKSVKINQENKD